MVEHGRGRLLALLEVAVRAEHLRRWSVLDQMVEDRGFVELLSGPVEPGLHQRQRAVREVRALVQHCDQVTVADDGGARNVGDRAAVDVLQRRPVHGRSHDPCVQRARQRNVAGIPGPAGHLVECVFARRRPADDGELPRRLDRDLLDVPFDALALHELAVGHANGRVADLADDSVFRLEPIGWNLQVLGSQLQQHGPGLRRGGPEHRAELPDRERAERSHVPRAEIGVAHDHFDRVERDVELFRKQLCQRGHRALAEFDLADEARRAPVLGDPEIRVEVGRVAGTAG